MINRSIGRGRPQMPEAATTDGETFPGKLESVLKRIEDRPGDMPIAVSAGFLRWIAKNASEVAVEASQLRAQLEVMIREYHEASEMATRLKDQSERATEALKLADVRASALSRRVAKLQNELSTLTGKPITAGKRRK